MPNFPFLNMPFFGSPYYNRNYYNNHNNLNKNSQVFLSIFGLDLYFDDILILCILFSLYTEGVKDEMLFICLLLLLLTWWSIKPSLIDRVVKKASQ